MVKYVGFTMLFFALLGTKPIFAEAGWTSETQVLEIIATTAGKFIIHAQPKKNPTDCRDKNHFFLDYGLSGSQQVYKLLLDAALSKSTVKLYVTGRCELFDMSELSKASLIIDHEK
ncbi:hypothetical protein [sulfur-oxidizing endosymbiont of Gigantopelta aegis]|uniref:hypothetical protein n=1 Tax=sulfur-oxidizing endosymbiont of Gigantopelta aegis TaxID=2794934 RepID=UPI001BE48B3D|nr:hypothetical protein [sulfur-oxidizing endosymbiont of Gigantopelta aegis]